MPSSWHPGLSLLLTGLQTVIGQSRNWSCFGAYTHIAQVCHVHQSLLQTSTLHRHITSTHTCMPHLMYTHGHTHTRVPYYVPALTIPHSTTHNKHTEYVCTVCLKTHITHTHIFFQMQLHTACPLPSKASGPHVQTHDIHTNHVSPVLSLPSGPLRSPTLLNSFLRQVT